MQSTIGVHSDMMLSLNFSQLARCPRGTVHVHFRTGSHQLTPVHMAPYVCSWTAEAYKPVLWI